MRPDDQLVRTLVHTHPLAWALVDGDASTLDSNNPFASTEDDIFIVQATSPTESRWKGWVKHKNGYVMAMNAWLEPEVLLARCGPSLAFSIVVTLSRMFREIFHPGIDVDTIHKVFHKYSPTLRTCLDLSAPPGSYYDHSTLAANHERAIHNALEALASNPLVLKAIVEEAAQHLSDSSSKLFLIVPDENRTPRPCLITSFVTDLVVTRFFKDRREEVWSLYHSISSVTNLRTAAGWLYESFAHRELLNQENRLLFNTQSKRELKWYFPERSLRLYPNDLGQTLSPSLYFKPVSLSHPSFDAFFWEAQEKSMCLLQMTIAEHHPFNKKGITELRAKVSAAYRGSPKSPWWFIFVVPDRNKFVLPAISAAEMAELKIQFVVMELRYKSNIRVERGISSQVVAARGSVSQSPPIASTSGKVCADFLAL
jgi:hypothetical protein